MKKLILSIIILSLCLGTGVFAQGTELPSPGLTPDSPFYFLDTLGEKIGMFFAFGAEKKAEKAMQYAGEKLMEVKAMAEKNKPKAIEKANQKYQEFLGAANQKTQEAKEQGKDVERLVVLISEKTLKHQEILAEVFEKVSEQAKAGIEKAIEMSQKGFEEAIKAVSGAKKQELQKRFVEITEKVPVYPGASEVEVPLRIKQEIQRDLSLNVEIIIHSSDDSPEKVADWYESQLVNRGWEKIITEKHEMPQYKKDEIGLGIVVILGKEFEIKEIEEEKTAILLVKDEFEAWEKFLGISKEEGALITKTADDCEKITSGEIKDTCYLNVALETKNASLCEKTINKDGCYASIARETEDVSLCEKVMDIINKNVCYIALAQRTQDSNLCEKAPKKDMCYWNLALHAKDSSLCEKIIDSAIRYSCIAAKEEEILARNRQRKIDINQIVVVMEVYYSDNNQYFQSKMMPATIRDYLPIVPKDPLTGNPYFWLDNTSGSSTGCDAQHYCVWAELEGGGFQAASEKSPRVKEIDAQPAKCPCW